MNMIKALKVFARHKIRCRITETIDDYAEENIKTANEIKKNYNFGCDVYYRSIAGKGHFLVLKNCWETAKDLVKQP